MLCLFFYAGFIPAAPGLLTNLKRLNLERNHLAGKIVLSFQV
jgi:hypothetical protein